MGGIYSICGICVTNSRYPVPGKYHIWRDRTNNPIGCWELDEHAEVVMILPAWYHKCINIDSMARLIDIIIKPSDDYVASSLRRC